MINKNSNVETIRLGRVIFSDKALCNSYKEEYSEMKSNGFKDYEAIDILSKKLKETTSDEIAMENSKYADLLKYSISRVDFGDIMESICGHLSA